MARPQAADYEDRKQDLLRAAAALFAKQGYNETLLEDIAEQCGIKKSSLYHYHRSKHAILQGLVESRIEDLAAKVEAATDAANTPAEKFHAMTATLINEYISTPNEITVLLNQTRHLNKTAMRSVAAMQHRIINRMTGLIQELRPDIEIARKKVTAVAMLYFGMTNWIHVWYEPSGSITPSDLATLIVRMFLNGLNDLPSEDLR